MIHRDRLEDRVLGGLRDKLLHPGLIAAFVEEYQREYNKAIQADLATRRIREAELAKVEQSIAQLVDAIADGMYHPSMKEKMAALEVRKTAIRDELSELGEEEPLRLHPGLSGIYRRKVAALTEALNKDETSRNEAVEVLRGLVSTIRLTPDSEGELQVELVGELGAIMLLVEADGKKPRYRDNEACSTRLVAGAGFEPAAFRL